MYTSNTTTINNRTTTKITGNIKSFDDPPSACFSLKKDSRKINEPHIILKYRFNVIFKHFKSKLLDNQDN